jgi:hypothetical protein
LDAKENEENVKLRDTTAKQRFVSSSSVASGAQEQENRELREKISKLHNIVVKLNIGDGEDQPNFLITSQFEVLKAQIQRIASAFYNGDPFRKPAMPAKPTYRSKAFVISGLWKEVPPN